MVWLAPLDLGWRPYVQTWMAGLHEQFTDDQKTNLYKLFDDHVDNGIKFFRKNCLEYIPTVDINLVTSVCSIFQSLTDPELGGKGIQWDNVEEADKVLGLTFAFAYTWAIGGNTNPEGVEAFDDFVHTELEDSVKLPGTSMYDSFVDIAQGQMEPWKNVVPEFKYDPAASFFSILVPTQDTVRFSFVMDACLDIGKSVLYTGPSGVGKSVVALDLFARIEEPKRTVMVPVGFSAQTSSPQTQETIEAKLEKRRKTIFGAPPGKKMILFVDDVNMPAREEYGAQPPVELLRQFQDFKGFYDREKWFWKDIVDVTLVCACAPPGGGRMPLTPRFVRHFTMLSLPPASDDVLKTMFQAIVGGFLSIDFASEIADLTKGIVKGTVEVYNRIAADLLPIPAKSHYTFNLRDVSKTFQGVLMIKPANCPDAKTMTRLWCHECMRVFHDRLIDEEDQTYFKELLIEVVQTSFSQSWDYEETFVESTILFGDYLKMGAAPEDRVYEEIKDMPALNQLLDEYLFEYNMTNPVQMNLVFFRAAIEHISRVARICRLDKGNAMLVGVGGSGKQSCTRLATAMSEFKCFTIELKKGYDIVSFRDDIKTLFEMTGVEGKSVTFLLVDTQIVDESMLEDVNNVLNSGEVPGMYADDEKAKIISDMRPVCEALGIPATKDKCWSTFVSRCQNNLHIVLCMSPVGESFRRRCKLFPSLINCTTIDWFTPWPDDALLSVATKLFEPANLGEVGVAVAQMCVKVHQNTQALTAKFLSELNRNYYITPKSYLDLIGLYLEMLTEKRGQKQAARDRLLNGLSKLHECNKLVTDMEQTLAEMAPVLKEKSEATAELLKVVAVDQAEAEKIEAVVSKEAAEAKIIAAETKVIADDAQADLDKAMPALKAAVDALNSLNKGDITEIKSFAKPPALVQTTLEAVCILKGEKPDWATAKGIMSDPNFLQSLFDFDKDNIPDARLKKLKKYVNNEEFTPESVGKVSKAAKSLCMWCCAMDVYSEVAKTVEPKKAALHAAQTKLDGVMSALKVKEDMLNDVQTKVAKLQATLKEAQEESQRLEDEAQLTVARLDRAGTLTGALGDEAERWTTETGELAAQIELLVGDVFLSSACISYFGAFDSKYRELATTEWLAGCKEVEIPCSEVFSLVKIMGDPVQIRQWNVEALPTDDLSVENGILVTRAKRWPLMIDPQEQANKWVKNMEARNGLRTMKLSDGNYLRTLEGAIRIGSPVICEDLGEEVDPALEPVLLKAVVSQGGRQVLRLGETDVDYDENFRFYMTSKLPNPHYLPELCIKVTLINFTVTISGLEDQLLGDVVAQERPDLEETKNKLVISMASDAKQLKDLEDKTLHLLQTSEGNVLDNIVLIKTLNNSKLTSGVIKGRVADAEKTEIAINEAREGYRSVATRGSLLYFVIADLGLLDPMYQYSLEYFKQLFNYCIEVSEKSDDLPTRLLTVIDYSTYYVYLTVCRGLFERHRLIYSFLICTSVMRNDGEITFEVWNFLLRGAGAMKVGGGPNPDDTWISAMGWELLNALEILVPSKFVGFCEDFQRNIADWQIWFDDPAPHTIPLPGVWGMVPTDENPNEQYLDSFTKLLVLKALKPDKVSFAMGNYVAEKLGSRFTEVPPLQLQDIFMDTKPTVPTIFVLSSGADPTKMLLDFAEEKGFMSSMGIISLGAGQGPIAERLIESGCKKGQWVCLQNCHLATSWLPKMEKVIADLSNPDAIIHEDFRLWLMSMPSAAFPVSTLQSSIKLTNEPPKGLRANMIGNLGVMKEEYFESCTKPGPWKKLMYGLVFFHAMIQERLKFGPLGWNVAYAFNNSDLECSMSTLKMFLDEQDTVPWESLLFVTGEINYGGRVTDDQDRRCLLVILAQYYKEDILDDDYRFSESGKYYAPPEGTLDALIQYNRTLPPEEQPEVFGMHVNALTAFNVNETTRIIDTVLSIQPRVGGSGDSDAMTPDQMADSVAESFQNEMPSDLDPEQCAPGLFDRDPETEQMDSLATVLIQEIDRFNGLLKVLRETLILLRRAIKGLIVMSFDLEEIYNAFLLNRVPKGWEFYAYPSLKPLSSWWKDLCDRMSFMHNWNSNGVPPSVALPYIFFTTGFLTGTLQKHARKHIIPIDSLDFSFIMTKFWTDEDLGEDGAPEDGLYIRGLFLDAARFDLETMSLEPSELGAPNAALPYIHLLPVEDYQIPSEDYQCPVYRTAIRAGVLTTTGASSNYVFDLSLPTRREPNFFVLQGTAGVTQLSD
jgi:dynein heavy chain